jgi:putative nucleotidyltransferase with HDIG domain
VLARARLGRLGAALDPARRGTLAFHGVRAGIAVALAALTSALFPAAPAVEVPIYEVGSVAGDNVIAPLAFTVPKSEAELGREREELLRAAEPVFTFVRAALDSSRAQVRAFDAAIAAGAATLDARFVVPAVQQAAAAHRLPLTVPEAAYLAQPQKRGPLIQAVSRAYERWLTAGVAASGVLDTVRGGVLLRRGDEERRVPPDDIATFNALLSRARLIHPDPASAVGDALYVRLLTAFFHPTIVPDPAATRLRHDELARAVSPVKYQVQLGEKIVGANEVVGRAQHEKLRGLRDALEARRGSGGHGLQRVLGGVLFNFLVLALLGAALALFRRELYANVRHLVTLAAIGAIVIAAAAVIARAEPVRPELVPIAFAAVLLSLLFDQRISLVGAMVLAVLIGGQSVFRGTNALFMNLLGGAAAALAVRRIRRRNDSYRWILIGAASYAAAATAIGMTLDWPARDVVESAAWGGLNAAISVVLALQILPLAEHFTGIETDLTLLEWSDLNRPLMQRLSLEAPGTYAHTVAVANLAEAACRAIGANPLLARVGCYYHDIGKLARPQYFVENQRKGLNPHDKLRPDASASIIRNHVRDGLELAQQHGVPRRLRAFITEHHGTGSISYFLERARERAPDAAADPSEYAYPGPLPQTAETAVVMLADGVEAAVRVLSEPSPKRIREVVDHIVRQRTDQGQLRDAPLTLRQIDVIKEEFARVLSGMYHGRVDYPAASGGVTSEFAAV